MHRNEDYPKFRRARCSHFVSHPIELVSLVIIFFNFDELQMLLALAGWMSGYGGGFPFDKPGDLYGEEKYVGMRVVGFLMTLF